MSCNEIRNLIDRRHTLEPEAQEALAAHSADCEACRAYEALAQRLEDALDTLGTADLSSLRGRLVERLGERAGRLGRQFRWALAGTAVSALAAAWFIAVRDPFGYFALTGTTLALAFQSWRTRRQADSLRVAAGSDGGVDAWRRELCQERREVLRLGPIVTLMFTVLTTVVLFRHGLDDLRSLPFLAVTAVLVAYVAQRLSVRLPLIDRELALLDEFDT